MGFLNFLKKDKGNKQELTPPTNPDSTLAAPLPNSTVDSASNKGMNSDLSLNNQTSQTNNNNDTATAIPKPPLSDDYDMVHSDDEMDTGMNDETKMPSDDFGAPIQQEAPLASNLSKQSLESKPETVVNTVNTVTDAVDATDVDDIDDDLPDFDDHDMQEAKTLDSTEEHVAHTDLPVFDDADELSEEEIHSFVQVGDQKELYVSAESYQTTIDLIKDLKRSARKFDSGVRKVKESMNVEKDLFDKFTTSLKLTQQNLLSMDNKFQKR